MLGMSLFTHAVIRFSLTSLLTMPLNIIQKFRRLATFAGYTVAAD